MNIIPKVAAVAVLLGSAVSPAFAQAPAQDTMAPVSAPAVVEDDDDDGIDLGWLGLLGLAGLLGLRRKPDTVHTSHTAPRSGV